MAVKQKVVEVVGQTPESRLQFILRTLEDITTQGLQDKMCADLVVNLGAIPIPSQPTQHNKFIEDIHRVQAILEKEFMKYDLIYVTLKALYNEISTAEKYLSPVMSIVLQLIDVKHIPGAVDFILQTPGAGPESLKRALRVLVMWLTQWIYTDNLGLLVFTFIQGVEKQEHYDILYDVTMESILKLFSMLVLPHSRKSVGPVVLYMLSQRHSNPDAFLQIIPQVKVVVDNLYKENSESSRVYLKEIGHICVVLMNHFPEYAHIYPKLRLDLEPYMSSLANKQSIVSGGLLDGDNLGGTFIANSGKVGLNNLGNTCYMNSVLQALFMTKPFRNEVLQHSKDMISLLAKLQSLFALLQHSNRVSLSPNDISTLARPPGFLPGHQHDSSEFLGYLLDVLHEQEKNNFALNPAEGATAATNSSSDTTIVQTTFGGKTVTVSRCSECGTKSERLDNFRELQLSIPNSTESQSVQTLLDFYLTPEKLSGDNQYQCDVCDRLTDGERVTCIAEAPRRLILTLKHFRYDPKSQQRTKLLQSVQLDSHVRLEQEQGYQYELYAAVVHCGSSVDSGHYYTFAKGESDVWFKFNDCTVTQTVSEVMCGLKSPETPYILFYRRVDCTDPETLPRTQLLQRLQLLIGKDHADFCLEKRKRPLVLYNSYNRQNWDDEPPPPGCGGSGFSNNSSNMYVC